MNIFLNLKINLIIYERCELKVKVILKDNIKGVGKKDEVINASDGYARNFLFPKKLAQEATDNNLHILNNKKENERRQKLAELEAAQALAADLKDKVIKIIVIEGSKKLEVCRNARCTFFLIHYHTTRFIFFKL